MSAVSTASDALRLRMRIEAPPDAIVKAITEPDLMTEWLAESVEVAPDRYESGAGTCRRATGHGNG
jgi:uncharacterized protein YndB with AHSA1/START domain